MKTFNWMKKMQQGFTLIELMIVVAIIGILTSIGGPAFVKYQSKARTSEAKLNLGGLYTSEKAFFGEYSSYVDSIDAIGFSPDGSKRFYSIGFSLATCTAAGMATVGYNGTVANPNNLATAGGGTMIAGSTQIPVSGLTASGGATFLAGAAGNLRVGAAANDIWTINDTKILSNTSVGL